MRVNNQCFSFGQWRFFLEFDDTALYSWLNSQKKYTPGFWIFYITQIDSKLCKNTQSSRNQNYSLMEINYNLEGFPKVLINPIKYRVLSSNYQYFSLFKLCKGDFIPIQIVFRVSKLRDQQMYILNFFMKNIISGRRRIFGYGFKDVVRPLKMTSQAQQRDKLSLGPTTSLIN